MIAFAFLIGIPNVPLVPLISHASPSTFTLFYKGSFTSPFVHFQLDGGTWTAVPGKEMTAKGNGYFSLEIDTNGAAGMVAAFNNGAGKWDSNNMKNYRFDFSSDAAIYEEPGKITSGRPNGVSTGSTTNTTDEQSSVSVYYKTGFSTAYIHYSVNGKWTTLPGVKMSDASIDGYKMTRIELAGATSLEFVFNDGGSNWDNNSKRNYKTNISTSAITIDGGAILSGAPKGVKVANPTPIPTPKSTIVPKVTATPKKIAVVTPKPTAKPIAKPTIKPIAKPTAKPVAKIIMKPIGSFTKAPTPKPNSKPFTTILPNKNTTTVLVLRQTKKPKPIPTPKPVLTPIPVDPIEETPTDEPIIEQPTNTPEPKVTPTPKVTPVPNVTPVPKPITTPKVKLASNNFSWDNASVYFLITDRFQNGDTSNDHSYGRKSTDSNGQSIGTFHGGDLKGLKKKIEDGYFTKLGVNAIWLTAPYEQIHGFCGGGSGDFAHYAYHGYYVLDYTEVDQNMGTVQDMRDMVDAAHARGIRIVMDIVMNHAGYNTLVDMQEYSFGKLNGIDGSWQPSNGQNFHSFHDKIDYKDEAMWAKWWGPWIRAGISGYTSCGGDDKTQCLANLPDFRTELTNSVGMAPVLTNKWSKEANGNEKWVIPAAESSRKDMNIAPADYISKWLAAWVEEFGIDGFRVDTAKHVDMFRWAQLKKESDAALQKWRSKNSDDPASKWKDPFWMVGEVWGHGVGKDDYFNNGYDALLNFSFQGASIDNMEGIFSGYASQLNNDDKFNMLSYLSSHDTSLYDRGRLVQAGTALLLAPGAIQIYYGDETAREKGPGGSDKDQGTRSDMNWNSINQQVLTHWQKIGSFRNDHLAVGAGQHKKIGDGPYTFSRTYDKNGISDGVVVALGAQGNASINVGDVFADGTSVRDAYSGSTAKVSGGKVSIQADASGVVLLEEAN